jgi:flagellar M-ring protein FliF
MAELMTQTRKNLMESWNSFDGRKKRRILLLGILLAIAISIAGVAFNTTRYSVLFTDMNIDEAGEILTSLNEVGIKARISDGNTVMVDSSKEEDARMQMAMKGYPKSGQSYDLYMNSINFATSSQDKNIMLNYQLQDRLSATIANLEGIKDAVVTISTEDENVFNFNGDETSVSASVVLDLESGFSPDSNQILAIKRLMVTSISGLSEANIAVIDSNLNDLLPAVSDGYGSSASGVKSFEQEVEQDIADKVRFIFEPVFGAENIKVAVNATVDLDIKYTEIIEYSPVVDNEGIPFIIDELSEKTEDSSQNSNSASASYSVESDSLNDRVSKVINYRVNELRQTIEEAPGGVEDISVSILINDEGLDSTMLANVKQLASAAVGIDESKITVGNMNFVADEELKADLAAALGQDEGFKLPISEKAIVSIAAMIFVLILAMMLMKQIRKPNKSDVVRNKKIVEPAGKIELESGNYDTGTDNVGAAASAAASVAALSSAATSNPGQVSPAGTGVSEATREMLNQKDVILDKFKEDEDEKEIIKGIESLIDASPASIADVISLWLNEEAAG